MRIDRGAQANNRTRRNWQRLVQSTATADITLSPGSNNALINTSTGYGVFVDNETTYIHNNEIGVLLNPTGGIISTSTSTGLELNLFSTGSLLTVGSTGAITTLPVGTPGQVLTVSSTTSTDLAWAAGSGGSGALISTGDLLTVNSSGTQVRLPKGGNYYVLQTVPSTVASTDLQWYSTLRDLAGTFSVGFQRRLLYTSTNVAVADWQNLILGDLSLNASVDWKNRFLVDAIGNQSVGWNTYNLADSFGTTALTWDNPRALYDGSGIRTLDFAGRVLLGVSGATTEVFDWSQTFSTGDLLVYHNSTDGFKPLRIGSNGQVLTVDNTKSTSTAWVSPSTGIFPVVSSDPASPTAGQAWFNSTQLIPKVALSVGANSTIAPINTCIYATAQTVTLSTSSGNQIFSNSIVNFPAGFWNVLNRTVRATAFFAFNASGLGNNFTVLGTFFGTTVPLYSTSTVTVGTTGRIWMDFLWQVDVTGVSGDTFIAVNAYGENQQSQTFLIPGINVLPQPNGGLTADVTQSTQFSFGMSTTVTGGLASTDLMRLTSFAMNLFQ